MVTMGENNLKLPYSHQISPGGGAKIKGSELGTEIRGGAKIKGSQLGTEN